jgi:hypothetical protein
MAKLSKRRPIISLYAADQQIKARRKELPKFKPLDVNSLIIEAEKSETGDLDTAFILEFCRRKEDQLNKLLQHLGIDPLQPNAWQIGFSVLATYYQGVGRLALYPRRTKNAGAWTPQQDLALLLEVEALKRQGLSERGAVKSLSADPKKQGMFRYHSKRSVTKARHEKNREDAMWAHLQMLKRTRVGLLNLLSPPLGKWAASGVIASIYRSLLKH